MSPLRQVVPVPVPAARPPSAAAKPADGKPAPPTAAGRRPAARPAPRRPTDLEALAAAALADEPKPDGPAPAPTTIDFDCPMCGQQLHMPLELAGKRDAVPGVQAHHQGAGTGEKRPGELAAGGHRVCRPAPDARKRRRRKGRGVPPPAAATVSREALQEAGAVPRGQGAA